MAWDVCHKCLCLPILRLSATLRTNGSRTCRIRFLLGCLVWLFTNTILAQLKYYSNKVMAKFSAFASIFSPIVFEHLQTGPLEPSQWARRCRKTWAHRGRTAAPKKKSKQKKGENHPNDKKGAEKNTEKCN